MTELARRVEIALAQANATLLSAHAHLSKAAAVRLSTRIPASRAIALYSQAHELSPVDSEWIRIQTLAHMGADYFPPEPTLPAGTRRIARIRFAIREWLRVRFAPHGDPVLREMLTYEYAHARAILLKVHVRNALRFAAALQPEISGPAAVVLYIDRVEVPRDLGSAVYALSVGQLAAGRFGALLAPGRGPGEVPVNRLRERAEVLRGDGYAAQTGDVSGRST